MPTSLFEKYGGFSVVSRIVMDFYSAALESDEIGDYFADIDLGRLMDHQTKFVSSLMGGPASISDDRLAAVHRHLAISDRDFDVMNNVMAEILSEHGVTPADVAQITRAIESKRSLIVTRAAA